MEWSLTTLPVWCPRSTQRVLSCLTPQVETSPVYTSTLRDGRPRQETSPISPGVLHECAQGWWAKAGNFANFAKFTRGIDAHGTTSQDSAPARTVVSFTHGLPDWPSMVGHSKVAGQPRWSGRILPCKVMHFMPTQYKRLTGDCCTQNGIDPPKTAAPRRCSFSRSSTASGPAPS